MGNTSNESSARPASSHRPSGVNSRPRYLGSRRTWSTDCPWVRETTWNRSVESRTSSQRPSRLTELINSRFRPGTGGGREGLPAPPRTGIPSIHPSVPTLNKWRSSGSKSPAVWEIEPTGHRRGSGPSSREGGRQGVFSDTNSGTSNALATNSRSSGCPARKAVAARKVASARDRLAGESSLRMSRARLRRRATC